MTRRNFTRVPALVLALLLALLPLAACQSASAPAGLDYSDAGLWVYREEDAAGKAADVFFLCPASFAGKEGAYLLDLSNEKGKANFAAAVTMEKAVYDENARFFSPYYRQAGYEVYAFGEEERLSYVDRAYEDVKDAFAWYLEHENNGRPLILAGFSEGAEMTLRLLKEESASAWADRLVAAYVIGWRVTEQDLADCPRLRMAQGEADTGVIISYNTEAPEVTESPFVARGQKALAINPLNWRTDSTPADKSENLGYCYVDGDGVVQEEIPGLTGAYLDPDRGTLKVTDIDPTVYTMTIPILGEGVYHLYDVYFFYRNLQQNVQARIAAFAG